MLPFCIILFFLSASKLKFHLQSIEVDLPQERFCCFVWIFLPWNSCLPPLVLSKGRGHFLVAGVEENLAMWIYPQPSLRTQRDPDRRLEALRARQDMKEGPGPMQEGTRGPGNLSRYTAPSFKGRQPPLLNSRQLSAWECGQRVVMVPLIHKKPKICIFM